MPNFQGAVSSLSSTVRDAAVRDSMILKATLDNEKAVDLHTQHASDKAIKESYHALANSRDAIKLTSEPYWTGTEHRKEDESDG